jgi:hypothetical protein
MMTSSNDIQHTEQFLLGSLPPEERLLFQAKLLADPQFRMNMEFQKKTYSLINLYGRKKLKVELEAIHQRIFADPGKMSFSKKILQLFSKS